MVELEKLLRKIMNRARSSRVWTLATGNLVGIELLHEEWPKAAVLLGVNLGYIVSETVLKLKGKG